jgi:ActR/RegA family two-component response regulator
VASPRVLVVLEESTFRAALARALEREGYEVAVAVPAEAAEFVRRFGPAVVLGGAQRGAGAGQPRWLPLRRPVSMEELRRVLRETPA